MVVAVVVADVEPVDAGVVVCVVSHPGRSNSWSGSSRYAVTRSLRALAVSSHVSFDVRTTVCQISTAVFEAPENSFSAREVYDALASRGKETLRPPSSVPSTTLRAAHSYISFSKSPKHGSDSNTFPSAFMWALQLSAALASTATNAYSDFDSSVSKPS